MERRLSAILAADVVGYSRLMGDNEAATLAALKTGPRNGYRGRWRLIPTTSLPNTTRPASIHAWEKPTRHSILLERLLPHANHETKAWIKHDSDFDPLCDRPRYQKILELIG
jgi:hypothetical protein